MKKILAFFGSGFALAALLYFAVPPAHHAQANEPRAQIFTKTVDVASLADGVGATNTVTAPGAALGDFCLASMGVDMVGITVTCYISAANVISVRIQNESTATVDLASTTQRVMLFKSRQF